MKHTELILEILQQEADECKAHSLHLSHQLGLPPNLRVNELPEDEMQEALSKLNLRSFDLEDAITWLKGPVNETPNIQSSENPKETNLPVDRREPPY